MNQKILTASLAALVLTTGAFSVQAADSVPMYSLDAVVVTANRTPERKIDTNADVAIVTADEIAQKHYSDVSQAVSTVPGVFLSNHGGNAQVYQTNSIYINGSSNVVVLVDGVRRNINGITGTAANLGEMINMDSIDHIEVLKGSASTLYGSDAQGGVINVITKKPADNAIHTTLKTSFGNNDAENYNIYNEGKEGKVFWTAEAGKEMMGDYKDGWGRKVINHFNSEHYKVKLGYDLGNNSDISLNYEKYPTMPVLNLAVMIPREIKARRITTTSISSTKHRSMTAYPTNFLSIAQRSISKITTTNLGMDPDRHGQWE